MSSMLEAAFAWRNAGFSVVRVSIDGTKSPDVGKWGRWQNEIADDDQLAAWFGSDHPGIGVVTGEISGNIEMLEFEGRAITEGVHSEFFAALHEHELLQRIASGYLEASPSGGLHFFYRVSGDEKVSGNTKLAQREARDDELTPEEWERLNDKGVRASRTLIETRGEHGFVVVAPSHGPVHATGKPWSVINGSLDTIASITPDERDAIHGAARASDRLPLPEPIPDPGHYHDPNMQPGDLTPGEDFNTRGRWEDILGAHGWTIVRQTPIRTYWRRPSKVHGISAVTGGEQGDYFYCWSTSTDLPAEETLSKWRVYAFLDHAGDFKKAASKLRAKGFGSPRREPVRQAPSDDGFGFLGPVTPVELVGPPVAEPAGQEAPSGATSVTVTKPAGQVVTFKRSDDGNALELIDRYGSHLRFCPERGKWLLWQGTRWEWAEGKNGGVVREYAKRIARNLPDEDAESKKHKRFSLSANGTSALLMQASTDPRVVIRLNNLDAHPFELNTPGGIVNLRTGELMPHDPRKLHTRTTTCTPDFSADASKWMTFLSETFAGREDLIPYIQRLAGYSVSGVVGEHVLPFAHGSGRNGKGVFLESIQKILGDYSTVAPNAFLMAQNFASHETEIARLAGSRMVLCSEVNQGDRFDEAKVKLLTGGDTITARFMRQDHFTFEPTHKLWLMGNDQPTVGSGGGPAFWERLKLIPFENFVPPERRILNLQDILATDHGPSVLAWVVLGAVHYFNSGLAEPESVKEATSGYAYSQDSVHRWFDECCQLSTSPNVRINTHEARRSYEQWCNQEDEKPTNLTRFGNAMKRMGIEKTKSNSQRFYEKLILIDSSPAAGTSSSAEEDGPQWITGM